MVRARESNKPQIKSDKAEEAKVRERRAIYWVCIRLAQIKEEKMSHGVTDRLDAKLTAGAAQT